MQYVLNLHIFELSAVKRGLFNLIPLGRIMGLGPRSKYAMSYRVDKTLRKNGKFYNVSIGFYGELFLAVKLIVIIPPRPPPAMNGRTVE